LRMESDAIVLPESAVQPGQDGPFVYIVKDGRARTQNVTVDRQVGELAVISKGLTGSEQIIGEVPPTLTDGSQVSLKGADGEPAKGSAKGKGKGKKSEDSPAKEASSK
jgi:membrane fusion protein, multidrug efflux system